MELTEEDIKQAERLEAVLGSGEWSLGANDMINNGAAIVWFANSLLPKIRAHVFELKQLSSVPKQDAEA